MARRSPLAAARGALVSMVLLMILMAAGILVPRKPVGRGEQN